MALTRAFSVEAAVFAAAVAIGLVGCGTPPPPPAAAPSAEPANDEPSAADQFGTLDILCEPPTKVLVDGKPVGTSPLKAVKVAPGSHDVTFADEESGNRTMTVKVDTGESRTVISDRPRNVREPPIDEPKKPGDKKGK